ncbi:hypothetical protein [Streptacidiphilus albus]|uniref:hypothetical protein n=1 Tax=Streptacidiphilus albus TaxID=105425 RepID=UPI00128C0D92|nr:hypothetical protein [Streptacidiphilus albus]
MDERLMAMTATMKATGAAKMLGIAKRMVATDPDVSGRDVLARLESAMAEEEAAATVAWVASEPDRADCIKCGGPVETDSRDRSRWIHSADGSRGCRAATFTVEDGWDETIPKSWNAAPKRSV